VTELRGVDGKTAAVSVSWPCQIRLNVRRTVATLLRRSRRNVAWPSAASVAAGLVAVVAVVIASMVLFDGWAANAARRLPVGLIEASRYFTELGKSGWFLWPIGIVLVVLAVFDAPAVPRFSRLVLAAVAVRLGFVFTAIAVPGLVTNVLKRVIGRARPFVRGEDVWAYVPFSWPAAYASLPSGHATAAFSALVAIGALYPRARAVLWVYAILIAFTRVAVSAHYPSDVLAGAVVGGAGALVVRNWFAARRLAFRVGCDGSVTPMAGPGVRRTVKAVARWLSSE
jgi:undecaprenyl-diphosphatase